MVTLLDAESLFDLHAFENSLRIPAIIDRTNGGDITLQVRQFSQFLGLYDLDGDPLYTTVWGYGTDAGNTSYPGPTILAYEGVPITVHWQNELPLTGHLLPVDTSLHFAESTSHPLSDGFVPIVSGKPSKIELLFVREMRTQGPISKTEFNCAVRCRYSSA